MNARIHTYRVTDTSSPDFKSAMTVYSDSFPKSVARSIEKTTKMISENYQLHIAKSNDVVGIALVYFWENLSLLDYLAIQGDKRGLGTGSILFKWIAGLTNHPMLFEVKKVTPKCTDPQYRNARIRFYEKLGCHTVTDRYLRPLYDGSEPEEMKLMVWRPPGTSPRNLNTLETKRIIKNIHTDVYGYAKNDLLDMVSRNLPQGMSF